MKHTMLSLAIFTIALLITTETAFAQRMRMEQRLDCISELNLTEAQKDKIADIRTKHDKQMIDLRADLQKSILEKREYMRSKNIDRKKYLQLDDNIDGLRSKIRTAASNMKMDIYEVLDDNQKSVWSDQYCRYYGKERPNRPIRGDRPFRGGWRK
ncbi:MAG: Spy/CpxP family protein refolding chaperone [Ignavibacterium sp.]|nr:Spy/CpxP family protein refolding chaperone [Ignavibacterium sp.]